LPRVRYPARRLAGVCAEGETILDAVRSLGFIMDHACGGNALCGTCCVKVVSGEATLTPVEEAERVRLRELGLGGSHRLACQAKVFGDIVVIPAS